MRTILILLIPIIFIVAVIRGIKRGFMNQLISLVSTVVAVIIALMLCAPVANAAYDGLIEDKVCDKISATVEKSGADAATDLIVKNVPSFVTSSAKKVGLDIGEVIDGAVVIDGNRADSIAKAINDKIARPFILVIVKIIAFLIIFAIVKILIGILAKALNIVAKLPVINKANKLLGGVVGAVKGAVFGGVIIYAISLFDKIKM